MERPKPTPPDKFLIGFLISPSTIPTAIHNAALDMWGTNFEQVTRAVATMATYQEFQHMIWISTETRRQAASAIYWALSLGAGTRAVNAADNSDMPLMYFFHDLQRMPALTAVTKEPIDMNFLYHRDLMLNAPQVPTVLPLAHRPYGSTIILPPPLDSMMPSRSNPSPDIVVPYFEIGITLDRNPSNEMIGRAVAALFPQHPTAWQYHIRDMIARRDSEQKNDRAWEFTWIAANDRLEAGHALYWGISFGTGVIIIDSHTAQTLPLVSFFPEITATPERQLTAIDSTPITRLLLRECDIHIMIGTAKPE